MGYYGNHPPPAFHRTLGPSNTGGPNYANAGFNQRQQLRPPTNLITTTGERHQGRRDGPAPPKMATYDSKRDWRPFELQFERTASRYGWSDEDKLDKLVESLREKALKFYSDQPRVIQEDYIATRNKLRRRYGRTEEPITVRRQLQELKQKEDEPLEEFADRAHELAADGYPGTTEEMVETLATDAFLKGCHEKRMDKQPASLDRALQIVKNAVSNQRVLLGETKPTVRQVHFLEGELYVNSVRELRAVQVAPDQTKQSSELKELSSMLKQLILQLSERPGFRGGQRSPSGSPTTQRRSNACFSCGGTGHFARECPTNANKSPERPSVQPQSSPKKTEPTLNK